MWRIERLEASRDTHRWQLHEQTGAAVAFDRVIRGWNDSEPFRAFWSANLRELPFEAYAWECPPVTGATRSRPFECVFVASPSLDRLPPDPRPFADYLRSGRSVVTFGNLGGDALLVAPCAGPTGSNYSHLGSFTATAPQPQQSAFWRCVGQAFEARIGTRPTWLSTAGHGVAWLHVRLDSRPKYYRHAAYAKA
jgi:hypothetical protein